MKVKCIDNRYNSYLTIGKEYEVVSLCGDDSKFAPGNPVSENAFEVYSDRGRILYCLFDNCGHAVWEVVV